MDSFNEGIHIPNRYNGEMNFINLHINVTYIFLYFFIFKNFIFFLNLHSKYTSFEHRDDLGPLNLRYYFIHIAYIVHIYHILYNYL